MPRYKVTLAYDGTDFVGWQRQATGASVQGLLEDALYPFENQRIVMTGAGRTDAGVHALGQVAAFSLERPRDPAVLVRALNARLPPTVRVLDGAEVPSSFHPRFDAASKSYRYRIFTGPVLGPFEYRYAWHLPGPLDIEAMSEAASLLVGRHDFASFQSAGSDVESTVRELFESRVERKSNGARYLLYHVRGDGFLRHMVRAIVGSLVEVGKGRRRASWIGEALAACDRTAAGPNAPPDGLCLTAVEYAARLATQP
jgi:tRNA pseudouridine38-40 synthase